jgi:cell shape-determining protein MreC
MKHSEPRSLQSRIRSPWAILAIGMAASVALLFLPSPVTQFLRNGWREALLPGLQVLNTTAQWTCDRWSEFRNSGNAAPDDHALQIAALQDRIRQLETQLVLAQSDVHRVAGDLKNAARLPALLVSQAISARVLGRQAQSFLQVGDLLDGGKSRGITPQALVIENPQINAPQLLDQGRDAGIAQGNAVLAGARIWGRITEVGAHTSTVQRLTDNGYRDLVQLASKREGRLQFVARGVLVGRGEPLCKIELVETNEPITVGDLVFGADDGVVDVPLVYGRIARLERKPAALHWEIWMEPALSAASPPAQVTVLEMKLNPQRLAGGR